jgi:hypothetical protein
MTPTCKTTQAGIILSSGWLCKLMGEKSNSIRIMRRNLSFASPADTWKKLAEEKRRSRDALIPKKWTLSNPPPLRQLDVMKVPEQSGILTEKEVEITNAPVEVLLPNIATKRWSDGFCQEGCHRASARECQDGERCKLG